jgi:hypothetical protein
VYVCLYILALESVTGRAGLGGRGWMVALIDDCDDQMDAFWFLSGLKGGGCKLTLVRGDSDTDLFQICLV